MSGRRWTPDEIALLEDRLYHQSARSIAKLIGRTEAAVLNKAQDMGVPRRDPGILTLNETCQIIGTDYHVVRRWIDTGELPGSKATGRGRYRREYRIREDELVAWLKAHPWMVDRDQVEPAYRPFVAERYITLGEAFRRGAAHATALGQAAYAGLVPGQRKRGLFWVVPESALPALVEARRMNVSDPDHRRQLVRFQRTQRVNDARKASRRRKEKAA